MDEVRSTIRSIQAIGLKCTRTDRGRGNYRITAQDGSIVEYATSSQEAISKAVQIVRSSSLKQTLNVIQSSHRRCS